MDNLTVTCAMDRYDSLELSQSCTGSVFLKVKEGSETATIQLNEESARQIHNWLKTKYKG